MGQFAFISGISTDIYRTVYTWMGHMRGGLAMATILACAGFAAICGSSLATGATMGMVAIPEMKKYHYDHRLSTGCVAAGGTLGILIPPSIGFVIYGILTEVSIGKLFMAGFIPGILLTSIFIIAVYIQGKINMKSLVWCLLETGKTTAMIFLIIIGANIFSTFLGLARLPFSLADFIATLAVPKIAILIGIILMFIALGCVMDCYAIMILTVP